MMPMITDVPLFRANMLGKFLSFTGKWKGDRFAATSFVLDHPPP